MLEYLETLREPLKLAIAFYREWWYLILPALLSIISIDTWKKYIKDKYFSDMEFVLLSFSVPQEVEKSPRVMEQFFSAIFGIQSVGSWSDQFWRGRQQLYLSLEMVGIGGVLRFIIWMPKEIRDYIEAALYAEYPEAEIEEIEDYVNIIDWETVDRENFFFGAELKPVKEDFLPTRTYVDFEDKLGENAIVDPIAGVAELLSALQPGEMVWIQILASPSDNKKWLKAGMKYVDKIMLREEKAKGILPEIPFVNELLDAAQHVVTKGPEILMGNVPEADKKQKDRPEMQLLPNISPGERLGLEAMERNLGKPGFNAKIRFLYTAPKEIARADSIVSSMFGIFWQFGDLTSNGLAPHKKFWTKIDYFFPKIRANIRKEHIWSWYRKRKFTKGGKATIFTTEELASLFHIPTNVVHAPGLERIESRKGEPPFNLPVV